MLTGLAARCDWVVLSDLQAPHVHLYRNRSCESPRHIFLSLRAPFHALAFFAKNILPGLHSDFVLVSGSEDITLPQQTDRRWRGFMADEQAMISAITSHPRLLRWYVENLDSEGAIERSPIPLGLVDPGGSVTTIAIPEVPALMSQPGRVFVAHRIRPGPQWETRRLVSALAAGPWRDFCTLASDEMPEAAFKQQIEQHAFVLCADGGGLDPSPKAWTALLHGAIPIIRRTALAPAYAHLPVAIVEDWAEDAISTARLAAWLNSLSPQFDTAEARRKILYRLTLDYWWDIICCGAKIENTTYYLKQETGL